MNSSRDINTIRIIQSSKYKHERIVDYYSHTVHMLGSTATVVDTDELIEEMLRDVVSFISKYALVVIDDEYFTRRYDWNAIINRIVSSDFKTRFNIIISTKQHITKSTLRSRFVSTIEI